MKKENLQKSFKVGARVQWNWMGHQVKGEGKRVYLKPVTKILRGQSLTRNGCVERPSYLIRFVSGSEILKLHTELTALKK